VTERCRICSGGDFAALAGYEHAYLAKCNTCGLVFSARTPTGEELQAHYSHKYSNKYAPDVWVSPITRLRLKELASEFEAFRETGRILDVGCGQGLLLEEAKSQGWSCYGTEYSEDAIDFGRARGFEMHSGELKADSFEPNSFDVVALTEVIEHMSNPLEDLLTVSGFLRDGGLLYLTTPNFNSLSRRTLGAQWNVIEYPAHLCYFTPSTIGKLAREAGFYVKRLDTTGVSISRLKKSLLGQPHPEISPGDADEQIRNVLESSPSGALLKRTVNHALTGLGVGDAIKAFLVKGVS